MNIEYSIDVPAAIANNSTKLFEAVNAWLYQIKADHTSESDKGAYAFLANYRNLDWENVSPILGSTEIHSIAVKTLPGAGGFGGINFRDGNSAIMHIDTTTP